MPSEPASVDTQVVEILDQIITGPDGSASLAVKAIQPGTCIIRFVPVEGDACAFDPTTDFFMNVRVLPTDNNYDDIPDEQLTFEFVYQEVLKYYHLIYPAMSPGQGIDFSKEQRVGARASSIATRIDKDNWYISQYMPKTRELSDGKRKLLMRWCQLQFQKH